MGKKSFMGGYSPKTPEEQKTLEAVMSACNNPEAKVSVLSLDRYVVSLEHIHYNIAVLGQIVIIANTNIVSRVSHGYRFTNMLKRIIDNRAEKDYESVLKNIADRELELIDKATSDMTYVEKM